MNISHSWRAMRASFSPVFQHLLRPNSAVFFNRDRPSPCLTFRMVGKPKVIPSFQLMS